MRSTEIFHSDHFDVTYSSEAPKFSYGATVSDNAGSTEIRHPFGMIVLRGSLTVRRPDDVAETRTRGFVSRETIPTGEWAFMSGEIGCRYVCIHPNGDREFTREAILLNKNERSPDLSDYDWLLIADGEVIDSNGPIFAETIVDLRMRETPYRVTATEEALLVALNERHVT